MGNKSLWIIGLMLLISCMAVSAGLSDGLVNAILFNETAGNNYTDYVTLEAATDELEATHYEGSDECVHDGCVRLNSTGYVQFYEQTLPFITNTNFTYSLWVEHDTGNTAKFLGFGKDDSGTDRWLDYDEGTLGIYDGSATFFDTTTMDKDTWHLYMIRGYANGSVEQIFDGVIRDSKTGMVTFNDYDDLLFGTQYPELMGIASNLNGMLDEFYMWDRTLTDAEIAVLFANTTYSFYPWAIDDTINISVPFPPDLVTLNQSWVNITAYMNNSLDVNCTLFNSSAYLNSTLISAGVDNLINFTQAFANGMYTYQINCTDTGMTEATSLSTFLINYVSGGNVTSSYLNATAPHDWTSDFDITSTAGMMILFFYLALIVVTFTFGMMCRIPLLVFLSAVMMFFLGFIITFKLSILFGILVIAVALALAVVGALMI